MEYKPHDYQQFAINYILEHPIAAVILGMGLGKTSITLTAIEQLIYDSFEVRLHVGTIITCISNYR